MNDVVWLNSDRVEKLRLRRRALAVIERHVRQSVAHALESVRAPWLFGLWRAERIARDVLERQAFCYAVNVIEFALLRAAPSWRAQGVEFMFEVKIDFIDEEAAGHAIEAMRVDALQRWGEKA